MAKSFRKRLSKLFSNNIIIKRVGKDRLRVVDTGKLQGAGNQTNSKLGDRYKRMHGGNQHANYNTTYGYHGNKQELYTDYETMDKDPLLSSALNIYADESCMKNDMGDVLRIESSNEEVKKLLHNLFYDILNIEFNLWTWTRALCKYGDMYLKLDVQKGLGVVNAIPLSAYTIERLEGHDPTNPYKVEFVENASSAVGYSTQTTKEVYDNFEIAHFRMLIDTNFLPYGKSMLEGGRQIWKALRLMEDAMLIHRIMRAPEKRIFKIDVGNIPPNEVDNHMSNIINSSKKVPFIDNNTGEYNLMYNMQNLLEDFYLPVRGASNGTEIETLGGLEYSGVEDIEYLLNRLFSALLIPKPFLGYDEGVEGKSTLASMDVRFARTIERIQKILLSELSKIAMVHLAAQGFEDADLINFKLDLASPSIIYEQEKIELWSSRMNLARDMKDLKMFSEDHIYREVFKMSEGEIDAEKLAVIESIKQTFRKEQIETEGNDPAKTGQSFGTAHDIASMHVSKQGEEGFVEEDPDQEQNGGRPPESGTYGTHDSNFTRDPLGKKDTGIDSDMSINHNFRKNSPLAYEGYRQNSAMAKSIGNKFKGVKSKSIIHESLKATKTDINTGTLLDENNIVDE